MKPRKQYLTVLDLFCGAGGFSEGFKQQGFKIVQGVDCWKPAVETFNHNFGLDCEVANLLDLSKSVNLINTLPDTNIVIGSPPCVSFSSSNKCGKADKTLGVNLTLNFFRIIAVKKHQPNSKLKAWFMENVVNSEKYISDKYTFKDLDLSYWARKHNFSPNKVAINIKDNRRILDAGDFGVAQSRKRLFTGEVIKTGSFPELECVNKQTAASVKQIFRHFPHPFKYQKTIIDSNYIDIKVKKNYLTDHFYDTGIYELRWKHAQYHKINHPYMGKMFFPENLQNRSRTVTASKLDGSREAIVYNSELERVGDGQYRTPTVRESAVLMSFPITYQFLGQSENSKWRLVGNAVCPLVSTAIAKATLKALNFPILKKSIVEKNPNLKNVINLNTFKEKTFDNPPIRKKECRFRRHPFKVGNMTVTLSNYCLKENGQSDKKWRTTVTYGTGKNYKIQEIKNHEQTKIRSLIKTFDNGNDFIEKVHNGFLEKIACGKDLQDMYENNYSNHNLNPIKLIEETAKLVSKYANGEVINANKIFQHKSEVHQRQLYALYVINQISKIANARV